jgi:predicted ribosomally synthesized peptide with nif11-like leader
MSLENVKLFYEQLSVDRAFNTKIQGISQEEFTRIIKDEGYDFTYEEFEDYTALMLESISEEELEAIAGGIQGFIGKPIAQPIYGVIRIID